MPRSTIEATTIEPSGLEAEITAAVEAVEAATKALQALEGQGRRLLDACHTAVMAGDGDGAVAAQRGLDEVPLRRLAAEVRLKMTQARLFEMQAAAQDDQVAASAAERDEAEERWRQELASGGATRSGQRELDEVRRRANAAYNERRHLLVQRSAALAAATALVSQHFAASAAPIVRSLPHARTF